MSINAGTIVASLLLDTSKFSGPLATAGQQLRTAAAENATAGQKLTAVGAGLETIGSSMTRNVTVPIVSAGAAAATTSIKFEDAFAGVRKTVDATEDEYRELSDGILDMSTRVNSSAEQIAGVMEAAGQLGIAKGDLLDFTETMVMLGDTTNLSATGAATSLARVANIAEMSPKYYGNLGSSIVALGNNFATTESEIVDMATNLAAAGKNAGISLPNIFALATAMSSVGIEAAAGGTSMSTFISKLQLAVETGKDGKNTLEDYAAVAGMSGAEFKKAWGEDATGAITAFIGGLQDTERNGKTAIATLDSLGITETRMRNMLLSLSNASDMMNDSIEVANAGWNENNALQNEANQRYGTTASQLKMCWNEMKLMGIQLGNQLLPYVKQGVEKVSGLAEAFSELDEGTKKTIVSVGIAAAAAGPVTNVIGKIGSGVGGLITNVGKVVKAVQGGAGLVGALTSVISPATLVVAGIAAVAGAGVFLYEKFKIATDGTKDLGDAMTNVFEGAAEFGEGIKTADGILKDFDDTIIMSAEKQQEIATGIQDVQDKIIGIAEKASSERRGFTQSEIEELERYYDELNTLTEKQYTLYYGKLDALHTIIENESSWSQETAQNILADSESIHEEMITLANETYANTIALLNQQYTTEEERQSESYKKQIAAAQTKRDEQISIANEERSGIYAEITQKNLEMETLNADWYVKLQEHNEAVEAENQRNAEALSAINEYSKEDFFGYTSGMILEAREHKKNMNDINKELADSFDETAQKEAAALLYMLASTETTGGEITTEMQTVAENIAGAIDSLPEDTRESMRNTWLGMKEELEAGNPELFAAAEDNADSIINAIDATLGIQSPSRVMKARGRYTIQGFANGMSAERKSLLSTGSSLMQDLKNALSSIKTDGIGSQIVSGIKSGMNATKSSLMISAANLANSISSKIRNALKIQSPSRVMMEIGQQTGAGMLIGLTDTQQAIEQRAQMIASAVSGTFSGISIPDTVPINYGMSPLDARQPALRAERLSEDTLSKLDRLIELAETLVATDPTFAVDGRTFGRLIHEYS